MSVNFKAAGLLGYGYEQSTFPDDTEEPDEKEIRKLIEKYMDEKYPEFEPEVVIAAHEEWLGDNVRVSTKEYFLPALKALWFDGQDFFSPQRRNKWENMELVAKCDASKWYTEPYKSAHTHSAPHKDCECGIYGSVNLEEMSEWLEYEDSSQMLGVGFRRAVLGDWSTQVLPDSTMDYSIETAPVQRMVLCMIEPSEDAEVHLCRKGWKASKAFISEIIDETISIDQASQILSLAWKRHIDVRRVYSESR